MTNTARDGFAGRILPSTVRIVFQEHWLQLGKFEWRGRRIDPAAIRRTALVVRISLGLLPIGS
jgi:poly-beta-hydroxyalkanoate depolymerase